MMTYFQHHTNMARLIAGGSLFLMGMALFFEHVMGLHPCKMCIWQRIPHMIVIALGVLTLFSFTMPQRRILIGVMGIALCIGAGLAFWHSGVELKLLPGPSTCSADMALDGDPAALLDQILAAPIVRCDEVPWSLFGLSMANWNFILTAAMAITAIASTVKSRRL